MPFRDCAPPGIVDKKTLCNLLKNEVNDKGDMQISAVFFTSDFKVSCPR